MSEEDFFEGVEEINGASPMGGIGGTGPTEPPGGVTPAPGPEALPDAPPFSGGAVPAGSVPERLTGSVVDMVA